MPLVPSYIKKLQNYNYDILVVLHPSDKKTINVINATIQLPPKTT